MRLLRPGPLVAIWTALCLALMVVGFVTLTSRPDGNEDLLTAATSPALSDGDVAGMSLFVWVAGLLVLLIAACVRQLWHVVRRSDGAAL